MKRLILTIAATLLLCNVRAYGGEPPMDKLTLEVPAAVKAAIAREVGDGKVSAFYADEDVDKQTIFVAKAVIGSSNYTIKVTPAGRLISADLDAVDPPRQTIGAGELPPAVQAALQTAAAGAPISSVIREKERTVYEIEVKIGSSNYTLRIDADGKLLSKDLNEDTDDEASHKSAA